MTFDLRAPGTTAEWAAYHAVRRHVLFELRGNGAAYDPNHPDDSVSGNHSLGLFSDGELVGVIRVDISGDAAIFRRVAIRADVRRRGHGRRLLADAEAYARSRGCRRVESHVDPAAIGFYERCGFQAALQSTQDTRTCLMTKDIFGR